MGKQVGGIFGNWRGKVGNVIGSSIYGIQTLRGYQPVVTNPRSTKQVDQRTAFNFCRLLGTSVNSEILIPLMKRFTRGMSQINKFISLNCAFFGSDGVPLWRNLVFSFGKLIAPLGVDFIMTSSSLEVSWEPNVDNFALPTDKLYLVVFSNVANDDGTYNVLFAGDSGAVRVDSSVIVTLSAAVPTANGYAIWLRADGSMVSGNTYGAITAE